LNSPEERVKKVQKRRMLSIDIDLIVFFLLFILLYFVLDVHSKYLPQLIAFVMFIILPLFMNKRTLGFLLLNIHLVDKNGDSVKFYRYILWLIFSIILLPLTLITRRTHPLRRDIPDRFLGIYIINKDCKISDYND